MKCPYCNMAELEEMKEIEYGEPMDKPYEINWLQCKNCHAEFDDEDDVKSAIDDIEQEKALKHDEYPEPEYEPEMDMNFGEEPEDDIPYEED